LKFVVCKPLQRCSRHSLDAYFYLKNATKAFGGRAMQRLV